MRGAHNKGPVKYGLLEGVLAGSAAWGWEGRLQAPALIVSSFLLLRVGEGSAPLGLKSRGAKMWRSGYRGSKGKSRVTPSPPWEGWF